MGNEEDFVLRLNSARGGRPHGVFEYESVGKAMKGMNCHGQNCSGRPEVVESVCSVSRRSHRKGRRLGHCAFNGRPKPARIEVLMRGRKSDAQMLYNLRRIRLELVCVLDASLLVYLGYVHLTVQYHSLFGSAFRIG